MPRIRHWGAPEVAYPKIQMLCDTLGRPLRFRLTAGQRHDNLPAKELLDGFQAEAVLAERDYDNNDMRQTIAA